MTISLAGWLTDNRETLLPRWIALIEDAHAPTNGNGYSAGHLNGDDDAPVEVIAHPDEHRVLLASIYEGLISAARGDRAQLDECLRLLRAFRTRPGEDELPEQLALPFTLRRVAWEALFRNGRGGAKNGPAAEQRRLLDELEDLLEYTTVSMAAQWTTSAKVVARELDETKLLVESLYHEAEAADRTTLQVSILNQIAQGLSATLDPTQQIAIVGEKLYGALEITHLTIWLLEADTDRLYAAGAWGDGQQAAVPSWRIQLEGTSDLVAKAFHAGAPVFEAVPDAPAQGAWYQAPSAVLAVPLIAQSHATGVIAIQHSDAEPLFDRKQHDFVTSAASQAAIALENARLYAEVRGFNAVLEQRIAERTQELQRERDMLQTLHDIALEVSSTLDLGTLLENSLSALAKLVDVSQGSIMLIDPDTDQLVHRAVLGQKGDVGVTRFPMGQGIVGWVAQHRKPALVPDVLKDSRWLHLPDDDTQRKSAGSMIAVPLIAQHDTLGVLLLSHDDIGYFNEGHLRLLSASAGEIALGIHNALLFDQIERQLLHQGEMRRRQEEENSQSTAILQSLSDGVIVCNGDGAVLAANPAVERILERPIEELVIWNLPELLKRLLGRRAVEVPVEDLLQRPVGPDNQPRTFSATFQIGLRVINMTLGPVLMPNGQLMGAVSVFRDITREVESDRLKTEFIGTVSHELRTPMTSIKGFTQLLAMGSLGPINDTQKEFLNTIQTNAERMISIINDLLDITKIETGSVELDIRPLHLAETLSNVVSELQSSIAAREHELSINIPPGLPLARADAKRINQILHNLLSNAVKYTPRAGKITFDAREVGEEVVPDDQREGLKPGARYVLIDIADTGVGIAPEEQEKIFERFYRTENPLKIEAGGTGLGLSLVRPLVELLGGRIWLTSAVGEGSTFSLIVPAS
jgi:signal transduction histidine kinase